jgi:hypothetical protein
MTAPAPHEKAKAPKTDSVSTLYQAIGTSNPTFGTDYFVVRESPNVWDFLLTGSKWTAARLGMTPSLERIAGPDSFCRAFDSEGRWACSARLSLLRPS